MHYSTPARLGALAAASAAVFAFGAAPAMAGTANGQCPGGVYCANNPGDPTPAGNGNGNGKATGKPGAGMVGNADNKNPQGQKPDAAGDGNNGYECDGNNGIAKTNPAHTGCDDGGYYP